MGIFERIYKGKILVEIDIRRYCRCWDNWMFVKELKILSKISFREMFYGF